MTHSLVPCCGAGCYGKLGGPPADGDDGGGGGITSGRLGFGGGSRGAAARQRRRLSKGSKGNDDGGGGLCSSASANSSADEQCSIQTFDPIADSELNAQRVTQFIACSHALHALRFPPPHTKPAARAEDRPPRVCTVLMYAMYDVMLTVLSIMMCVVVLHYTFLIYWYCCKNRKYYRWSPPPVEPALLEKAKQALEDSADARKPMGKHLQEAPPPPPSPTMAIAVKAALLADSGLFDSAKEAYFALRVQAAFRSHVARQRYRRERAAFEAAEAERRAIELVQRLVRGRRARHAWDRTLDQIKEAKAATRIQRVVRVRQFRKKWPRVGVSPPASPPDGGGGLVDETTTSATKTAETATGSTVTARRWLPAWPGGARTSSTTTVTTTGTAQVTTTVTAPVSTTTDHRWLPASVRLGGAHSTSARVAPAPHNVDSATHTRTETLSPNTEKEMAERAEDDRSKAGQPLSGLCTWVGGCALRLVPGRCCKGSKREAGSETRKQRRRRLAAEAAVQMKRPKFAPLPAILRFPTVEKFVMLTFSPALLTSASSVIGAQVAGTHVLEGWSLSLAVLIILTIFSYYYNELRTLRRFRRLHHDACWQGADPPESNAEVDDPIFACLGKLGLMKIPRLRGRGGFEPPEEDCEEPERTERALRRAFCCNFWRYCGGMEERAGDVLETLPMWTVRAAAATHPCAYSQEPRLRVSTAPTHEWALLDTG